jgi:uncharacterized ferritin-like protein (DUF455 family)
MAFVFLTGAALTFHAFVQSSQAPKNPKSLCEYGLKVLLTNDTREKAKITHEAYVLWKENKIPLCINYRAPPDVPARPLNLKQVDPRNVPKRGAGSLQNRIALIHSIAHMESYAIDLAWDIIVRFANLDYLPKEYFDDWVKLADDEARHFGFLADRLEELGSFYGDLPGHPGLWQAASRTSGDILARLAILHCVHGNRNIYF